MAVLNPANHGAYSEEYDYPALKQLAEMSMQYVLNGTGVPSAAQSDFDCEVWALMNRLIRFGKFLAENPEEASRIVNCWL